MNIIKKMFNSLLTGNPSAPVLSHFHEESGNLKQNIQAIKEAFRGSDDIIVRNIKIGENGSIEIAILYVEGLVDTESVHKFVMESLMLEIKGTGLESRFDSIHILETIQNSILTVTDITDITDFERLFDNILSGSIITPM